MGHMGFLYMQGIGKQCETTWHRKLVSPLYISYIYIYIHGYINSDILYFLSPATLVIVVNHCIRKYSPMTLDEGCSSKNDPPQATVKARRSTHLGH